MTTDTLAPTDTHQWQFSLRMAPHELDTAISALKTTVAALAAIKVTVTITFSKQPEPTLTFSYHIGIDDPALAAHLQWPNWQAEQVRVADYLWQETCLECFIAAKDHPAYVEINASPDGRYALYHFDDYRSPNRLPPPALYTPAATGQHTLAHIDWQPASLNDDNASCAPTALYTRTFSMPLSALSAAISITDGCPISIHPCVILRFKDTHLYFAPMHASPPDFHNKAYWSDLSLPKS